MRAALGAEVKGDSQVIILLYEYWMEESDRTLFVSLPTRVGIWKYNLRQSFPAGLVGKLVGSGWFSGLRMLGH